MGKIKRIHWGDESIRVEVRRSGVPDEAENQKVLSACLEECQAVRFRVMVGSYGPGTVNKPTPRYYWVLGESATVHCKDLEVANWFRDQLMTFLQSLDGAVLEVVP